MKNPFAGASVGIAGGCARRAWQWYRVLLLRAWHPSHSNPPPGANADLRVVTAQADGETPGIQRQNARSEIINASHW